MFPLWHGKVATQVTGQPSSITQLFPLWHGKVATNSGHAIAPLEKTFPLWHGKVATRRSSSAVMSLFMCFRFGMVKLQQKERDARKAEAGVSALAW